jgi:hypothetical protein
MSDYLNQFQSKTRLKADPELIRRWEWDARFHGDKHIKTQLASAKRTATTLNKSRSQFSNLRAEQELAINAAVSAIRTLAAELTPLAAWAKAYKIFCDAERQKEDFAELDAIAQKRWGGSLEALQFELDLMKELSSSDGRIAFGQWMHLTGRHTDVKPENISCAIDRLAYAHGSTNGSDAHLAALTVKDGMEKRFDRWTGINGVTVNCAWQDYEGYLAYRRDVAKTTARVMQQMTSA